MRVKRSHESARKWGSVAYDVIKPPLLRALLTSSDYGLTVGVARVACRLVSVDTSCVPLPPVSPDRATRQDSTSGHRVGPFNQIKK